MTQLPALIIEVTGSVASCNLDEYRLAAVHVINSINMELTTDEDFAQAKADIEWSEGVEQKTKAAIESILSQSKPVADVVDILRTLGEQVRQKRLTLATAVKEKEASIRKGIAAKATLAAQQHVRDINQTFDRPFLALPPPDFAAPMKGKRTLATTQAAVDAVLLAFNELADQHAARIRTNLTAVQRHTGMGILFPDLATLVCKSVDEVEAIVAARIQQHEAHEALRLQQERQQAAQAAQQLAAQAAAQAAAEERARHTPVTPAAEPPAKQPETQAPQTMENPLGAQVTREQVQVDHAVQAFIAAYVEPPAKQPETRIAWQQTVASQDDTGLWTIAMDGEAVAKVRFARDADQAALIKKMVAAAALLDSTKELISCAEPSRDRDELRRARQVVRFVE